MANGSKRNRIIITDLEKQGARVKETKAGYIIFFPGQLIHVAAWLRERPPCREEHPGSGSPRGVDVGLRQEVTSSVAVCWNGRHRRLKSVGAKARPGSSPGTATGRKTYREFA